MKLFGLPIENVSIVDIKDDGAGWTIYRIRYQYVSRSEPSMFWQDWVYAEDVPEIFGQAIACNAAVTALLACHS